jgi:hypothetical protein
MNTPDEEIERKRVFLQAVSLNLSLEAPHFSDKSTSEFMGYFGDANRAKHQIPQEMGPVQAACEFVQGCISGKSPDWAMIRN